MGSCYSASIYEDVKIKKFKDQFDALQLSAVDIGKLHNIYSQIDVDFSGTIGLDELLAHIDLDKTTFTESVFSIFDEDGSGEIDFREFVISLWNYCTLSRATLDLFAFDLYDRDSSGLLSIEEIHHMLRDIYGEGFKTNFHARNVANDLQAMEDDGDVNAEQFCIFAKTHHALLFPAFEMQKALQRSTLGVAFWTANAERRIEMSNGSFMPVAKFMQLHLNEEEHNKHMDKGAVVNNEAHEKALLILSMTGTKNQRVENAEFIAEQEAEQGYVPKGQPKPALRLRRSNSEQKLHEKTKTYSKTHKMLNENQVVKVLPINVPDLEVEHRILTVSGATTPTIPSLSLESLAEHNKRNEKEGKHHHHHHHKSHQGSSRHGSHYGGSVAGSLDGEHHHKHTHHHHGHHRASTNTTAATSEDGFSLVLKSKSAPVTPAQSPCHTPQHSPRSTITPKPRFKAHFFPSSAVAALGASSDDRDSTVSTSPSKQQKYFVPEAYVMPARILNGETNWAH